MTDLRATYPFCRSGLLGIPSRPLRVPLDVRLGDRRMLPAASRLLPRPDHDSVSRYKLVFRATALMANLPVC